VGYGGIGRSTARLAMAFGMKVLAFGRHPIKEEDGIRLLRGRAGLAKLLRESDAVVVALPLTNATRDLIGKRELEMMGEDVVLVNVGRGELVRMEDIYDHLVKNSRFVYATDVWWSLGGPTESFSPPLPFLELDNFIGTPHASGPSAITSGSVARGVIENLMRYFEGKPLRNVVNRAEYT
jgi:phosphoglycerate dehydrogenase-like enzyme